MPTRILVIDDEPDMLENYRRLLTARGWECIAHSDPLKALDYLKSEKVEFIITDLRMPGCDGLEVIKRAREIDPDSMLVVVTAYGSVESAVAAVKEGAYDYVPKPFTGDQLALVIERGLRQRRITRENALLKRRLQSQEAGLGFHGSSPAMQRLREKILRVAPTDAGVFIVGESGVGKELVARSLHAESQRSHGPFIPVDCVALPRDLIEGELFGHEKGAYTSADEARIGLFECADGGTLFLDEISELSIDLQAKLLRVLQERQFRRLGGRQLLSIDVRIVAASNRDPRQSVKDGHLREDLLYRLDVVRITVPPLRERATDVPELLEHFLGEFSVSRNEPPKRFSSEAAQVLEAYPWPGNVRELRNVVEQAVLLAKSDEVSVTDLPAHLVKTSPSNFAPGPEDGTDYKTARKSWISEFEKRYFQSVLERNEGNITRAAEEAGVDRKTLYRIIKEHRLL